jgi:hypothetical protein
MKKILHHIKTAHMNGVLTTILITLNVYGLTLSTGRFLGFDGKAKTISNRENQPVIILVFDRALLWAWEDIKSLSDLETDRLPPPTTRPITE